MAELVKQKSKVRKIFDGGVVSAQAYAHFSDKERKELDAIIEGEGLDVGSYKEKMARLAPKKFPAPPITWRINGRLRR